MSDNPYKPPQEEVVLRRRPESTNWDSEPFPYFLPIVQFGLRLLGVLIFAGGASTVVQVLVEVLFLGDNLFGPYGDTPTLIGSLVGNVLYAGFGAYCILDGRWVIEKVFLPSSERHQHPENE